MFWSARHVLGDFHRQRTVFFYNKSSCLFFTFKVETSWGSCFTAQGGGFTKTVNYTRQGLSMEVYKVDTSEKVGIKYMEVTVRKTGDY